MPRLVRRCITGLLAFVGVLALCVLWLAFRPFPLLFAIPSLEEALSAGDDRYRVEIGQANLVWGGLDLGFAVSAENLHVLRSDGSHVVRVPRILVQLSEPALLDRRLAVEGIRFEQPVVRLVRRTDGRFEVSLGAEEQPQQGGASARVELADDLFELLTAPRHPSLPLHRVSFHDADIALDDQGTGTHWRASGATLELRRETSGVEGTLSLDVRAEGSAELENSVPLRIDASVAARQVGSELELALSAECSALPVSALETWWPAGVGVAARTWVLKHIRGGRLEAAAVDATLLMQRKSPRQASLALLRGRLAASGLSVSYADGWPAVTGLETEATFDGDAMRFVVQAGSISDLSVEAGEVELSGLGPEPLGIRVKTRVRGPLASLTELLALSPLILFDRIGAEPGRPEGEATASVDLSIRPGRDVVIVANDFSLVSPRANARGQFEPGPDGGIQRLTLDPLRVGNNDFSLELARASNGDYELDLRGAHADLRPWLREGVATQAGALPALRIDAEVEELRLTSANPLRNVRARARRDAVGWHSIDFAAEVDAEHAVSVNLVPSGAGSKLDVRCDDLGLLLSSVLSTEHLRGGDLVIEATRPRATAPLTGHFELTDFALVRAPGLTRLLQGVSLTGLLPALRGEGLPFSLAEGDFRYAQGVAELSEVNAVSPSLVLRGAGQLELEGAIADLRGTAIPFARTGRLIDKVPLIGGLITGGGDGLFAADFQVQGPLADPEVQVGALSALTPSALRGLTGLLRRTAANAGSNVRAR